MTGKTMKKIIRQKIAIGENFISPINASLRNCVAVAREKQFDKHQSGQKPTQMSCISHTAGFSAAKHSQAIDQLKDYPDANCPKGRNMGDKSNEEHRHSSSRK